MQFLAVRSDGLLAELQKQMPLNCCIHGSMDLGVVPGWLRTDKMEYLSLMVGLLGLRWNSAMLET